MDEKAESLFSVDPDELDLDEDFEHGGYHWEALAKMLLAKRESDPDRRGRF